MLDSSPWRRVAKSAVARRVIRSSPFRKLDLTRRRWLADRQLKAFPERFSSVDTFSFLIGHTKSGGSLMGALLDAHREMAFADEADALRYWSAGFSSTQLFAVLVRGSHREAQKGRITARRLTPYSLAVPGQWQGRFTALRVVGDTRPGPSTRLLAAQPDLVATARTRLEGRSLRIVHVLRNPFDPISAMVLRSGRTFEDAINDYFRQCDNLSFVRELFDEAELLEMRYETLVSDPVGQLERVCRFLGVEPRSSYLDSGARLIEPNRPGERHRVGWTARNVNEVGSRILEFPFLSGYSYDG